MLPTSTTKTSYELYREHETLDGISNGNGTSWRCRCGFWGNHTETLQHMREAVQKAREVELVEVLREANGL